MLKPKVFLKTSITVLILLILNLQTVAQNGKIFVENLKNPIRTITISGLPQEPGFYELDQCNVCLPYGNKRSMLAKAKEILKNQSREEFYQFEEGNTYQLSIAEIRRISQFEVFWHIQNANTNNPTAQPLQRQGDNYIFPYDQASDGDLLAFSLLEDERIQEHGNPKELVIYIPINPKVKVNFEMTRKGELSILGIGELSLDGLPKFCDEPIASITKTNQRLGVSEREKLVRTIIDKTPEENYINTDASNDDTYIFDFNLTLANPQLQTNPSLVVAHYRQKQDGSMVLTSNRQVQTKSFTLGGENEIKVIISADIAFKPSFASKGDVLEIQFEEGDQNLYLYLPIQVAGRTEEQSDIAILGTTLAPKVPYMVLHDPPGDGSFATFESGNSFCRSISTALATTNGFNVNSAVKLGVAGSAGLIVTSDFEFSTTLSAGLELSTTQVSGGNYETCLEVTETFQTSSLDDVGTGFRDGDDLFIGYGAKLAYGIFSDGLIYDHNCSLIENKVLVFAPIGNPQHFVLTERGIQEDIERLEEIMATAPEGKAKVEAENQIDVWEQVLLLNHENKADESERLKSFTLNGGNVVTVSEELIARTTKSIQTEFFVETNLGIEFLAEAGGSGVSGGFEFSTSQNFGISTQSTDEKRKLISYQLFDDDIDNRFSIDVFRDPMYGTPFFKLRAGSRSSCPFEGGTQIDAPKLFNGAECSDKGKTIDIVNAPIGKAIEVPLEICNESSFRRSYTVRLDGQTNRFGAILDLNGRNLNDIAVGQVFDLDANSCITTTLQVLPNSNQPDRLEYFGLRLFTRPGNNNCNNTCDDEGVEDEIFINVQYSDKGRIDFCGNVEPTQGSSAAIKRIDEQSIGRGKEPSVQVEPNLSLMLVPNPTGEWVHIHYYLPVTSLTNISIFDLNGKLVKEVLTDQLLDPGQHSIGVQNLQMPSGTYLVRLQTEEAIKVKQLIVIKN